MRNIWLLFKGDLKRLTSNVVTGIIVLGLICLPSIFSWYNIIACWDVFDNTGNLTVAVANTDEGYESDLVPLKVNIGEQVVSALRANDQLNWEFTSEEDAIDGTKQGRYYAAVVIPTSFSRDMMTFYAQNSEHAKIVYYTNEKKSAVAPKVTDQGADTVTYQINQVFAEKLSEISLGLASSLSKYAEQGDAGGHIATLAAHVNTMSQQMAQASEVLTMYSGTLSSAQGLVQGSAQLLGQAQGAAGDVGEAAGGARGAVSTIGDAMRASTDALSAAMAQSSAGYAGVSSAIDDAFYATGNAAGATADALDERAAAAHAQADRYEELTGQVKDLIDELLEGQDLTEEQKKAYEDFIKRMETSVALQKDLADALTTAANSVRAGNANAQDQYASIKAKAEAAQASVNGMKGSYDADVKPAMEQLSAGVSTLVDQLSSSAGNLSAAASELQGSAGSISDKLCAAKATIDAASCDLSKASQELGALSAAMSDALASGNADSLRAILKQDTAALATALAAPVQLDRQAVFPADNFGSQMAPLYSTLAVWVGSLLLLVVVRAVVSPRARAELDDPRPSQLFLGRFGVFSVLSFVQTTVLALGNMLFLGVQANHPFLYLLCFWLAGQVFTFIIYTLVVSFANLGKAIAVILLIVQVTAGGGSFPLQVLPEFFQVLSPYVPVTHVINAMRAAMMGVYHNDFWVEMGTLLLFVVPFALLGLVLRKPLARFLDWYIEKVEDSKLVS